MPVLLEAVPNFAEGRDPAVLARLRGPDALDQHADAAHHRCVVTLAEHDPGALVETLVQRVGVAVETIDLRRHRGLHPRLGAADVLPVVPLAGTTLSAAEVVAQELAARIWERWGVPSWFYGVLAGGRRLADLRLAPLPPPLDVGDRLHPSAGVCCVGARPPLVAYNLVLERPRSEVSAILPRLRSLPGVAALTFPLGDGRVQLSTNLTDPARTGVRRLVDEVRRLLGEPGQPELVGLCPAAAAGPGCDGGLLETRLVAAGARSLAASVEASPDPERRQMAARLQARSASVAAAPATGEAMLAAAEEAVAFLRLGPALGGLPARAEALLRTGAEGLRRALGGTASEHPDRVRLLDHWLAPDSRQACG